MCDLLTLNYRSMTCVRAAAALGLLALARGAGRGECVTGEPPSARAKSFLLDELANGSVAVPPSAAELDCYAAEIETARWRNASAASAARPARFSVAVAILGELGRVAPHTTIGTRVVAPLARRGDAVEVVFSTTPSKSRVPHMRANAGAHRFARMPTFATREAARAALAALADHFKACGADAVWSKPFPSTHETFYKLSMIITSQMKKVG